MSYLELVKKTAKTLVLTQRNPEGSDEKNEKNEINPSGNDYQSHSQSQPYVSTPESLLPPGWEPIFPEEAVKTFADAQRVFERWPRRLCPVQGCETTIPLNRVARRGELPGRAGPGHV
jgi:hypothetical protein